MSYQFIKMQGLGNDFILFDNLKSGGQQMVLSPEKARMLCDRRFGIGADGVLTLEPPSDPGSADIAWDFYNPDGSVAEMCGNASRCVALYACEKGLWPEGSNALRLETRAGIKLLEMRQGGCGNSVSVRVDMGIASVGERLSIEGYDWQVVSVGNPHAVTFMDALPREFETSPVTTIGPLVERDEAFLHKTNVEFAQVIDERRIAMRVWERGAGETMACATGACAVAVAAHAKGLAGDEVCVELPGGELMIEVCEDFRVFMSGPAEVVFEGTIEL